MEEWKTVPSTEGLYQASTLGRVRKSSGEILSQSNSRGYRVVRFTINKKRSVEMVHRVIANTYLFKAIGKTEVNHINAIKSDNCVYNLEWCTRSENVIHANKLNLINYAKKISKDDVLYIREMLSVGQSGASLARKFNISSSTISEIKKMKTWRNV